MEAPLDTSVADDFRRWGYLQAELDNFGRLPPLPRPELDAHPLSPWRSVYCGSVGLEFMHLRDKERSDFLRERVEAPPEDVDRARVLELLLRAHVFETTLQTRYPGTKRFSLEGLEVLIPVLDELRVRAALRGAREMHLGMAHRGRLNAMAHTVGKPPRLLFAGFEDFEPRSVLGGGDVRYHLGASGTIDGVRVCLAANPSHLEAVDPVLLGQARARQRRLGGPTTVLPVLCHGDAAFAGQGVAAETLNLAELPGYAAGGTIHVVLNNLIGFTTAPPALHSSRFASDVARRPDIPVIHVNAGDPDAAVRAARWAVDYRARFGGDVVLDLIGFRRHGHSEVDDPTTTQPELYRRVQLTPPAGFSYAARIGAQAESIAARLEDEYLAELEAARAAGERPELLEPAPEWAPYRGGPFDPADAPATAVDRERLTALLLRICEEPEDMELHPKLRSGLADRRAMARGEKPLDWSAAEALAFATLLDDGVRVRLTGQDSRRGTFNQRHAVWVDVESSREHVPLAALGPFELHDSPLSEAACVGFEYGVSREGPEALTLWEAQFGDFVNGAQTQIDQFLAAGEDKWGLLSGLVLLLPHGYEGQGPEHSSARLERFLQLCGEDNWQIAQPTSAAQYFHLLRRQVLRRWRKPLIVFTPKGTLRHPRAASPLDELASGAFRPVLADSTSGAARVLIASGRVAHELRAEREKRKEAAAVVTLEELYPFPEEDLRRALDAHPDARTWVWVQEEPGNMGARAFVMPELERLKGQRALRSVHRSPSASPATGSSKAHAIEQAALFELAFSL